MNVRDAVSADVEPLARLWHEGWHDAHAAIVPPALARLRTVESFRERMERGLAEVRVAGPSREPLGFTMLKGDELYQMYVARAARGAGVAAILIADAEARLRERGVAVAWLACAIGNDRAARFYEKSGWTRAGNFVNPAETSEGHFALEVWRYEKALAS
jgi:GNAT superfamily N-acetyltransferase